MYTMVDTEMAARLNKRRFSGGGQLQVLLRFGAERVAKIIVYPEHIAVELENGERRSYCLERVYGAILAGRQPAVVPVVIQRGRRGRSVDAASASLFPFER